MPHLYDFQGRQEDYATWRPRWAAAIAEETLRGAGITRGDDGTWSGTPDGRAPVVLSVGAGAGSDAAAFKALGCTVVLVEPNKGLLEKAVKNLSAIAQGEAVYVEGKADQTNLDDTHLPGGRADMIVLAQAAHTLKGSFAGAGSEERARAHLRDHVINDGKARLAIMYYNPDPKAEVTRSLHRILRAHCPEYRASKTPLLNAEFFKASHFQPYIAMEKMNVSALTDTDVVRLGREDIKGWLGSYSFAPKDPAALSAVVDALKSEWFDRFQKDGAVALPYKASVTSGPIRATSFAVHKVRKDVPVASPLEVTPDFVPYAQRARTKLIRRDAPPRPRA